MNVLAYPLRYLTLRTESGHPLYARDGWAVLLVALVASAPFLLTSASYFGAGGFLDKFGAFSGVLTGFYIAALVGIATFATTLGDLDDVIENGPVLRAGADGPEPLTRRQYVSSMFGYLAFLALLVSFIAILLVILSGVEIRLAWLPVADHMLSTPTAAFMRIVVRVVVLFAINMVLAHMFVTTCHGLYYLIDRLYEKRPVVLPKPSAAPKPRTRKTSA